MAEKSVSNRYSKVKTEFLCDVCQVDGKFDNVSTAVTFCVDCMDCLCKDCMDNHSRNEALKTHKTLAKESFTSRLTPTMLQELKSVTHCSVHEVQFDYICEDHGELICHLCARKNHRSCTKIYKIKFSPESAHQEAEKIRNHLQNLRLRRRKYTEVITEIERQCKLRKNIFKQIQSVLEQTDNNEEKSTIGVGKEIEYQQTSVATVVGEDDLGIHEERLLAALDLDYDEKTLLVSKHIEMSTTDQKHNCEIDELTDGNEDVLSEISRNAQRLQTLQDIVTELVCTSYMSLHSGMTTDKKESLLGIDVKPVKEMPDSIALRDYETDSNSYAASSSDADIEACCSPSKRPQIPNCKSLNVSTSTQTICVPKLDREVQTGSEPTVVARLPLTRRGLAFFGSYDCLCYLDIHPHCEISGVVVLKSQRVVITDELNRTIKVYDDNFQFQFASILDGQPVDLCVANQDSETVAVSFGTKRLQIYSIQANKILSMRGLNLGLFCRGICHVSQDIVGLLATRRKVFDRSGWTISLTESDTFEIQYRNVLDGEISMTINGFNKGVRDAFWIQVGGNKDSVTIAEQNQISTFNVDGNRKWIYRSTKHNQLTRARGMTKDSEGNIYAAGFKSNNVHQLSSRDYRCSRVIIPNIESPTSIEYDPYLERLIVGCYGSTHLSVYRFT